MPSGWRDYAPPRKTSRYLNSFTPSAVRLLNGFSICVVSFFLNLFSFYSLFVFFVFIIYLSFIHINRGFIETELPLWDKWSYVNLNLIYHSAENVSERTKIKWSGMFKCNWNIISNSQPNRKRSSSRMRVSQSRRRCAICFWHDLWWSAVLSLLLLSVRFQWTVQLADVFSERSCLVGVYRKRSDAVVRINQSICFPQGALRIVYSATFIPQLLHNQQNRIFLFHCLCKFKRAKSHFKTTYESFSFFSCMFPSSISFSFILSTLWLTPPLRRIIMSPILTLRCAMSLSLVRVCPSSASPAHQPSHGSSERRSGPPGLVVVGARQWRPVSCALLHGAAQRASWEQLDSPLCLCQPWGHLLHSVQVERASLFSEPFILFVTTNVSFFFVFRTLRMIQNGTFYPLTLRTAIFTWISPRL